MPEVVIGNARSGRTVVVRRKAVFFGLGMSLRLALRSVAAITPPLVAIGVGFNLVVSIVCIERFGWSRFL
jgi:hypothetical protein